MSGPKRPGACEQLRAVKQTIRELRALERAPLDVVTAQDVARRAATALERAFGTSHRGNA